MNNVWSVTQLSNYLKQLLESNVSLSNLSVMGEVSNLSSPPSGHRYFRLKDSQNVISNVMWANRSGIQYLEDGAQVMVTGHMTFYGRNGNSNFQVESVTPLGIGSLSVEFDLLKTKLETEGLFDQSRKRNLPEFPKVIGVVTSASGSVWQDIQNVVKRRYPLCELLLSHASVQGEKSKDELCSAIDLLNIEGRSDVIILARGGGSLEDLWPFNEESLARTIFASRIPIVSGVGHETDITIADLVSDVRAPTPSAAAELVVPDCEMLRHDLSRNVITVNNALLRKIDVHRLGMINISEKILREMPDLNDKRRRVDEILQNVIYTLRNNLTSERRFILELENQLKLLDFNNILSRGFAFVRKDSDLSPVKNAKDMNKSDKVRLSFNDGELLAEIL
ncbi:MAG TPA: exodeoxyribonuclease VII large subunit [Dehalococcoidia bacterium]|nr:exodeoxyribonuclease VII large subunit [Dehalococcoidia bacterium]